MNTPEVTLEPPPELAATPEPAQAASEFSVWIPAARPVVVTALEGAGARPQDDPSGAAFAAISTRLPRHHIGEYIGVAREAGLDVVVLVHPGGEAIAVEALRGGGQLAIAEGDVEALRQFGARHREAASDAPQIDADAGRTDSVLDAFEASLGRTQPTAKSTAVLVDPVSGLPAMGALQSRLATLMADPDQQLRIVALSLPGFGSGQRTKLGAEVSLILHRRIAQGLRLLCQPHGQLYDIGDGAFMIVAPGLSIEGVEALGAEMAEMVEGYMPDGHRSLTLAVGHAGPECSLDPATLRELAGRAEASARQDERSSVLGAGELVRPLAMATELEVTMRLAELAARRTGSSSREEIANVAHDLALNLGFDGRERLLVRFCATIADAGIAVTEQVTEGRAAATAALLGPTAGPVVAGICRAIDEHWDGTGGPDGLAGGQIPPPARIIAVAERLVADGYSTTALEEGLGTRFDPSVVRAASELVQQR